MNRPPVPIEPEILEALAGDLRLAGTLMACGMEDEARAEIASARRVLLGWAREGAPSWRNTGSVVSEDTA